MIAIVDDGANKEDVVAGYLPHDTFYAEAN